MILIEKFVYKSNKLHEERIEKGNIKKNKDEIWHRLIIFYLFE